MESFLNTLPYTDLKILGVMEKLSHTVKRITIEETYAIWIEKKSGYAQSLIEGAGVLSSQVTPVTEYVINAILQESGCDVLYLPLLYEGTPLLQNLEGHKNFIQIERPPTCLIDLSKLYKNLVDNVADKIGSQARRRIIRFEKNGIKVNYLNGEDAIAAISDIENNSWKATVNQNMHAKGQFTFYAELIRQGLVSVRVAKLDNKAVAYRIEKKSDETLYILKWSFDEAFRRYSPGFYLLTQDLQFSKSDNVKYIDLYGSPDPMKLMLANRFIKRFDVAFPAGDKALRILKERAKHDESRKGTISGNDSVRTPYIR